MKWKDKVRKRDIKILIVVLVSFITVLTILIFAGIGILAVALGKM